MPSTDRGWPHVQDGFCVRPPSLGDCPQTPFQSDPHPPLQGTLLHGTKGGLRVGTVVPPANPSLSSGSESEP